MKLSTKKELDTKASDIEFLLISVIQGLVLQMLAVSALNPISVLQTEYWFYIISAFILILLFWSQAIIHALSFIDWPIDLIHTFLYFLASFFEVLAFNHITNPLKWFLFGFVFLVVSSVLYFYDLLIIKKHKKDFANSIARRKLYDHMYTEQVKEMKLFIPGASIFTGMAAILIYLFPTVFITQRYHLLLSSFQAIFSVILLVRTIKTFKMRSKLIGESYR